MITRFRLGLQPFRIVKPNAVLRLAGEKHNICYDGCREKPVREAISVVIPNPQGETLFALRSSRKASFPLTCSLPSYYVAESETPDVTIAWIGIHKLGVELKLVRLLNEGYSERPDFRLFNLNPARLPVITDGVGGRLRYLMIDILR